jgi:hypothetical protein
MPQWRRLQPPKWYSFAAIGGRQWVLVCFLFRSFLNTTSTDFANSCVLFSSLLSLPHNIPPPQAANPQLVHLQRLPPRLLRCKPSLGIGTLLPFRQMQQQQHQKQWYDVYAPRRTMFGRVQRCPVPGLCHQLRQTRHHVHRMFRWGKLPQCLSVNDWVCSSGFSVASCCLSSCTES